MRRYTYNLGFAADGVPIPDPSGFEGEVSALDTSAERDLTGLLHRNYVATKLPMKLEFANIDWEMMKQIIAAVSKPKFQFTFPDPTTGGMSTKTCYAGDRKWNAVRLPNNGDWIGSLNFSVIEY